MNPAPQAGDPTTPDPTGRRPVRSFVRRAGRMTHAQARAMATLWPRWGIEASTAPLDLAAVFGRTAPVTLEIGFGNGAALLDMAASRPAENFLGVEVHEPGVGHCLLGIDRAGLDNVRLLCQDALEVLEWRLGAGTLHRVNLYFPDPWPKKRHHKRRIVQPAFLALLASRLAPGGLFHVATDWAPYAGHVRAVMAAHPAFVPCAVPAARGRTRFEARGERLGHGIEDLCWMRTDTHGMANRL